MQEPCKFLKSMSPVNIYKSASAIYMTGLAKIAPRVYNPKCTTELAIIRALGQSSNQSPTSSLSDDTTDSEQQQDWERTLTQYQAEEQDDDYLYDDDEEVDDIKSSKERLTLSLYKSKYQNLQDQDNELQPIEESNSEESDPEYLLEDDDDSDLKMSPSERKDLLKSRYDRIYKKIEEEKRLSRSKLSFVFHEIKLQILFVVLAVCVCTSAILWERG